MFIKRTNQKQLFINTNNYRNSHGADPKRKQYGSWAFVVDGETVFQTGTFAEAAVTVANANGLNSIVVLS